MPNRSVSYANLNCKTCNDLATQYNAYGPVTEQNIEAFAAYANAQMNLTATAPEYLDELKKCRLIQHIVNFNGSNTKIESNNPVNFHLGNKDVTAEAWVYLRSGTGYHVILENAKFDNTKLRGMRLFVQDAKVYFAAFDGGTSGNAHVNTIGTIPLNQWVHIAATKHHGSSITYTIHINGTSVSLNTNNTDAPDGTGMTISQNVAIGYSKVNNTSYFNGHIRNVRIYNRRLTTTEIGANYNSGCISEPAIAEGLIYYARLDNGHGTTISDLAYPSTATLSNGTWEIKALPGTACLSTAELAQVVLCDKGGYRFGFNGQEKDDEIYSEGRMYTAEYWEYDAALARRWNVDPEIAQKPDQSSYAVLSNNPIIMIDPLGNLETEFKDADGNTTKTVDDGSNAVFQETGTGTDKHYEFKGYNEAQGGKNEVNLTTAIQEQQNMNNTNPALQENAQGLGETHCNQATQCIMKTVKSTETDPNTQKNTVVTGNANTMVTKLDAGTNPNYKKVDQATAEAYAKDGGLVVIGWKNLKGGHGHVLTYSVGANIKKGAVANIGPKKYSGFVSLNGAIGKTKPKTFYIYIPGKQ